MMKLFIAPDSQLRIFWQIFKNKKQEKGKGKGKRKMPNWVYNTLEVSGKPSDIDAFHTKARQPKPDEPDIHEFSFWNFIKPTNEQMPYYTGEKKMEQPEGYDDWDWEQRHEWESKNALDWYSWNIRNWGTKWDACEVIEDGNLYRFDTAWSHPLEIFQAITAQHPELSFKFYWEEEQGWGGEAEGINGEFTIKEEWDIPDSHADYINRGRECSRCIDGEENLYPDCPDYKGAARTFLVLSGDVYKVEAKDEHEAQANILKGEWVETMSEVISRECPDCPKGTQGWHKCDIPGITFEGLKIAQNEAFTEGVEWAIAKLRAEEFTEHAEILTDLLNKMPEPYSAECENN